MTLEQYEQAPSLSFLGNRKEVIETMRFSADPSITAFLEVYDGTPKADRKQIPLELIALKAQVDPNRLVGAFVFCFQNIQSQKSALEAMKAHPKVVRDTVKFAARAKGDRDRRMLHEAVRFLPSPKGATFNLNLPGSKAEADGDEEPVETSPDVNDLFPPINYSQEKWQQGRQKLLED